MINWVQIHLALNHFPVIGIFISVLLLAYGLYSPLIPIKRLSLVFCLASGLFVVAAYYSGEWSEDIAAAIPEIADEQLVAHHEAAKNVTWIGLLLAIVAFASLVARNVFLKRANQLLLLNLLLALFMLVSVGYTAHLGGLLRHPELENPPDPNPNHHHHHHDGDDESHEHSEDIDSEK